MAIKSDNTDLIGKHCFEAAGLGIAPFMFVDFKIVRYQPGGPGAPVYPGSSCDYCSTAIMNVCTIKDANGKLFKVGCDCVNKVGGSGLIKAYKSSKEFRQHQAQLRKAKDQAKTGELTALLASSHNRSVLDAMFYDNDKISILVKVERSLPWCGASGRANWLKHIKSILKELGEAA